MYCTTIRTLKSYRFVYTSIALLAAKSCCGRQAVANAVALLSTVGNVVSEKNMQGIWRAGLNWSTRRMRPAGRSLATPGLRTTSWLHLCSQISAAQIDRV